MRIPQQGELLDRAVWPVDDVMGVDNHLKVCGEAARYSLRCERWNLQLLRKRKASLVLDVATCKTVAICLLTATPSPIESKHQRLF